MATIDRRGATVSAADPPVATDPNPDLGIKAPVRVATTGSNIALAGLQTIDGIALAAADRVLVKDQTDAKTNGIYAASTGSWSRTVDAANNSQWANGTQVLVNLGAVNAGIAYRCTTLDPIVLGTSNIAFASISISATPTFQSVTIAPPAGTTTQALAITQTGPASSPAGRLAYNVIAVANPASVTLPATLVSGMSANQVHGLLVELTDTGASTLTSVFTAHYVQGSGGGGGDKIALHANAYANQGTIPGYLLGGDFVTAVDTGGTVAALVGTQHEAPIYGTGAATYRFGVEITNSHNGVGQASTLDAALVIDNNGSSTGAWKKGIAFGTPLDAAVPLDATADAIYFHNNHAATITNFVNAASLTVTGNIFTFPNFSVANTNNQNGITQVDLANNNAGTSTFVQYRVGNGTNTGSFGIGGTGASAALYTGRAYLTGNGAALLVGTTTSQPVVFAVNNAEVGRWDTSGNLLAPVVAGGSATGSTLTLESTTNGSPSGDSVSVKQGGAALVTLKGGNIGLGTETNPQAPFVFSRSATTGQGGAVGATEHVQFIGADASPINIAMVSYGSTSSFFFYQANGTAASPTASSATGILGTFGWGGYNGSTYKFPARVLAVAADTFSNSSGNANGAYVEIDATATGSSSSARAQSARFQAGVIIGTSTTDPGAQKLLVGSSVIIGTGALATNATDGFLYIPSCAGTPTGTPTAYSGGIAMVYDSTNNKLYVYNGAWKGGTAPGAWS